MNPLGPYGNAVAATLAVIIVIAAAASHLIPGAPASPWLDSVAGIAIGVVFGTQVVQNGTQTAAAAALAASADAQARLAVLERSSIAQGTVPTGSGVPPATPSTSGGG